MPFDQGSGEGSQNDEGSHEAEDDCDKPSMKAVDVAPLRTGLSVVEFGAVTGSQSCDSEKRTEYGTEKASGEGGLGGDGTTFCGSRAKRRGLGRECDGGKRGENADREGLARNRTAEAGLDLARDAIVKHGAAAGEALSRNFLRDPKNLGDTAAGFLLAVEEDHWLAVDFRHPGEHLPQDSLLLLAHDVLGGIGYRRRGIDGFVERLGAGERVASLAAEGVVNEVAGDAVKPGAELAGFLEFGQFAPGGDEDFLGEVLAAGNIAAGAVSHCADGRLVAGDQLAKGLAIACRTEFHQARVVVRLVLQHDIRFHTRLRSGLKRKNVTKNLSRRSFQRRSQSGGRWGWHGNAPFPAPRVPGSITHMGYSALYAFRITKLQIS